MTDAPRFAFGYDSVLDDGTKVEPGLGNMQTLERIFQYTTVAKLKSEARRRHAALWLCAYDNGVIAGPGTGYRTAAQQGNTPGGAGVWNSWHQGESPDRDFNGLAVDSVPPSFQHWCAMNQAMICQSFGLIIFRTSNDPATWNHQRRPYSASSTQEWWHAQPYEVNYGRGGYIGPVTLQRWEIDPKYDIEVVGITDWWNHELWGGVPVPPVDPPPPDPPPVDPPPVVPVYPPIDPPPGVITMVPALAGFPVLNPGASGPWVKVWQGTVNASGATLLVDGGYGPASQNVCKYIQGLNGLPVTGVVDLETWAISFPH